MPDPGDPPAGPLVLRTVAELRAAVGRELGPGPWLTVDPGRVARFAHASGGVPGGVGSPTPELLTLALTSSLAAGLYDLRLGSARVNYGVDRVRFPTAVPVGSRVRLRCTVGDPTPRPGALLVPVDLVVEAEGATLPSCVARKLSLVLLD